MNKITVLPSSRAIRHQQLLVDEQTLFLPNYITMSEFISKLCIVDDFKIVDDDSRVLMLLEASDFDSFSALQIERNFFTFTKNSTYVFKFFEELSAELYDIDELDTSDIYAEYEEHIEILQELYKRYELLCSEKKILDKIFLPKLYRFNEGFAKTHQEITLHIDGHLTNFELELLQKCCEFSRVNIIFSSSKFNLKMQQKFFDLGIELEVGYRYTICLNDLNYTQKETVQTCDAISCDSFSEIMLQVAFVKKKVYDFMQKGYEAHNIAVILPDENFSSYLKLFDEKANFNFAMGESYATTKIYKQLKTASQAIEQLTKESQARLNRVGDETYKTLFSIYYKSISEVDVISFLDDLLENSQTTTVEAKIFKEQIYRLKKIIPSMQTMSVKSIITLFLQRLSSVRLDDVRGGQITVMGVLETRSVEFDAVIVVDFNDKTVPRKSDKDMFLNTYIRENANLPTMSDRENLQKHYYELLFQSSKEVAISFVSSTQSGESKFLKYLGIKAQIVESESSYVKLLFNTTPLEDVIEKEIILPHSFKGVKLSATKLKTYLTCKRKYYLNYVLNLKGHAIPKDMPQEHEIGTAVHNALKELYSKKNYYGDVEMLKKDLHYELDVVCGESELEHYLIEMQKRKLEEFCKLEIQRFRDGYRVKLCEKYVEVDFHGIKLHGSIDRIDEKDSELFVLDYKTGSYPLYTEKNIDNATDFQLEFYHILASSIATVAECAYYDLKNSKIIQEQMLYEKLNYLESIIQDMLDVKEINFELCEDVKSCLFCDYKVICKR